MFAGEDNWQLAILVFIISIKPSVKFGMWNQSLALFSQSEVTIPSENLCKDFIMSCNYKIFFTLASFISEMIQKLMESISRLETEPN